MEAIIDLVEMIAILLMIIGMFLFSLWMFRVIEKNK